MLQIESDQMHRNPNTIGNKTPLTIASKKRTKTQKSHIQGFCPFFTQKLKFKAINPHQGINWPVNLKHNVLGMIRNNNHK